MPDGQGQGQAAPAARPDTRFSQLVSARLILRRFRAADAAAFAAYRDEPAVARYQSWDAPYSLAQAQEFIRDLDAAHPDTPGDWFQFAVTRRADGVLLGDCAAGVPDDARQAEIGFTIAPRYQGNGYATEAVTLLLGYLFGERGKHRVTADCDVRNGASAAVLRRSGFRQEGHLLSATWAKGEWTDDLIFAILASEWQARAGRARSGGEGSEGHLGQQGPAGA
ncbi:MAG TPA: GNAT family protein [Streptosporangiaceae bacterium]